MIAALLAYGRAKAEARVRRRAGEVHARLAEQMPRDAVSRQGDRVIVEGRKVTGRYVEDGAFRARIWEVLR